MSSMRLSLVALDRFLCSSSAFCVFPRGRCGAGHALKGFLWRPRTRTCDLPGGTGPFPWFPVGTPEAPPARNYKSKYL